MREYQLTMTDTSVNTASTKPGTNTKHRLSLLSSRQSGMRLRSSEDSPDKPSSLNLSNVVRMADPQSDSNNLLDDETAVSSFKRLVLSKTEAASNRSASDDVLEPRTQSQAQQHNQQHQPMAQPVQKQTTQDGGFTKLHQQMSNIGKQPGFTMEDLFRIMTLLKSDIQTKEIALNSFKTEQLKRLINPIEIKKSALANTYIKLQDQIVARDRLKQSSNNKQKQRSSSASEDTNSTKGTEKSSPTKKNNIINASKKKQLSVDQTKSDGSSTDKKFEGIYHDDHDDPLTIMNALLEILDRHPLLALPRDAMYCLDYACNDVSTKNYLNLKIQGLENLIDQHRRFRYYMGERLKRSEQRYMDLTIKLETERNSRIEDERNLYKSSGKNVLLEHIRQLKDSLEKEKASKQAIVMTLLNELLDERERNETLNHKVIELEKKLTESRQSLQSSSSSTPASIKPRVPAKPAQLIDKQRSQTKLTK